MDKNQTHHEITRLPQGTSSNTLLAARAASLPHGAVISLVEQTAGRGQRGNTWEAAPGQNITLSILLRPRHVTPAQQFMLSEMVSLAITEYLSQRLASTPYEPEIKWPNDIYVADRKICGILIEHSLVPAGIAHTIAGIGININQRRFLSNAPNPVSLAQLTATEHDPELEEKILCETILDIAYRYDNPETFAELHERYLNRLWRRTGYHPYSETATGRIFPARISNVLSTGHLQLTEPDGRTSTYAFKEVSAILSSSGKGTIV